MSRSQFVTLSYDFPEVCFRYVQFRGIAEYRRRVVYHGHEAAFPAGPCAVLPCDLEIRRDDTLCGDTAETDDDFGFRISDKKYRLLSRLLLDRGFPEDGISGYW